MCYDYYHGFDDFRSEAIGKGFTLEEYNAYREGLKVFQKWFDDNIFSKDPETMSETIMIMPYGWSNAYQSKISGGLEHRPIGSTILGAKGSDLMLIKLARAAFQAASWPTVINTGRYMFPLGDNVRNVAPVHESSDKGGFVHLQVPNS
ncbi:hypothetical protein N7540_003154 [Penicillium herquei]|nr:hypothetical protein N7540_003154 [Penicillium herquei]